MTPIPVNEAQRLQALRSYRILDTEPELEYDALARIASHAFDAPIALVTLIDSDRLWIKSRVGIDLAQLDRRFAFCSHAIMEPERPMVVPDLRADERFCTNPLVVDTPFIRFYAGAPIVDPDGYALGTVAVIDGKPRQLAPGQREALKDLSALVMTALRGRRRAVDLERFAMTDYLTGIGNRAQLDQALAAELKHAERFGEPFGVLCLDLDGFKSVNDRYGHAAGDEVLREVAARLSRLVRQGDTVVRMGGDEFAVVMRHGDEADVTTLASRLAEFVGEPIVLSSGESVQVTVSAGAAAYRLGCKSGVEILARADEALYQTKNRKAADPAAGPAA